MPNPRTLIGAGGAAWGTALPLLALLVAIPPLYCAGEACGAPTWGKLDFGIVDHSQAIETNLAWTPYIDNPGNGSRPAGEEPRCPGSSPPPPLRLTRFAFPRGFDPNGYPGRTLFACVLAQTDGTILAVRLAQPIENPVSDRQLIAAIGAWRFEGKRGAGQGWERLHLNDEPRLAVPPVAFLPD